MVNGEPDPVGRAPLANQTQITMLHTEDLS